MRRPLGTHEEKMKNQQKLVAKDLLRAFGGLGMSFAGVSVGLYKYVEGDNTATLVAGAVAISGGIYSAKKTQSTLHHSNQLSLLEDELIKSGASKSTKHDAPESHQDTM